jgi:CubicO group peptidase (beta-lactamase class C family)
VAALLIAGCQSNPTKVEDTSGVNLTGIDARVTALMATANVPGLTLAVIEGGSVVYSKAYGMADVDKRTPLTTDTVMYGASLTKAAFAYMVMQLVEEGVIDLDLPVTKQLKKPLPSYPDFADLAADPRWMLLTPRMMLAHTTGLINLRWINEDRKLDFKFAPGSRYVYSGEGLQVLQLIVEERTGVPLAVLMQTRVFDRFGMTNTSMVWRDDYVGRHSNRYDDKGAAVGHNQRRRARAAGSMDTTLEDYTRFMAGVLRGEGLQKKSLDEMLRAQMKIVSPTQFPSHFPGTTDVNAAIDLSYGLGWAVYQSPRGPAFFKEGSDTGTDNFALGFPNGQRALVMLSNSSNAKRIFFDISEHVMGKTCLPWFWMGYIPYDRADLLPLAMREKPIGGCVGPRGGGYEVVRFSAVDAVIPAQAGIQYIVNLVCTKDWVPACAGTTV